MKLKELINEYIVECEVRNFSKTTILQRGYALDRFAEFVGDIEVTKLDRRHVRSYIAMCKESLKASTVNSYLRHINGLLKFAHEEEYSTKNPCKTINSLKEEKTVITTYSMDTVQQILENLNGYDFTTVRNRAIVILLLETGIRNSEVCSILLSDIYDGYIKIKGKGAKERLVPLTPAFKEVLDRYMVQRNLYLEGRECEYLFISRVREGLNPHALRKTIKENVFKGMEDNQGVPITVHNFRRFFAQNMLDHTDLYTVSRLMGHESTSTTEVYLRSSSDLAIVNRGMQSPLSKIL